MLTPYITHCIPTQTQTHTHTHTRLQTHIHRRTPRNTHWYTHADPMKYTQTSRLCMHIYPHGQPFQHILTNGCICRQIHMQMQTYKNTHYDIYTKRYAHPICDQERSIYSTQDQDTYTYTCIHSIEYIYVYIYAHIYVYIHSI
jgi:hypothetical protein